jgi:hypothetical protein
MHTQQPQSATVWGLADHKGPPLRRYGHDRQQTFTSDEALGIGLLITA